MNPKLVSWDYGKEITVTLEDALMSLESLRFMLGGAIKYPDANDSVIVRRTAQAVVSADGSLGKLQDPLTHKEVEASNKDGAIRVLNLSKGIRTQIPKQTGNGETKVTTGSIILFKNDAMGVAAGTAPSENDIIRVFWEEHVNSGTGAIEVTISPSTFPGSYRIVGDTFIRSADDGRDEPFQFIIGKAKVASEVTLTLEAEGDPSTFSMTLNVLRSVNEDGQDEMMKLIRYSVEEGGTTSETDDQGSVSNPT